MCKSVLRLLVVGLNQCATGYPVPVPANPANIFQSGSGPVPVRFGSSSGQILLFWPDSSQIDK